MTVPQLDQLLTNGEIFFQATEEEQRKHWYLSGNPEITDLFYSSLNSKFLLFGINETLYLRLSRREGISHSKIYNQFRLEAASENPELIINIYGGGEIFARINEGVICLTFLEKSFDFGKYDQAKLKSLLDQQLDKRIGYKLL
ncbi:hypothetical protein HZA96_06505 [Candidatus Woesearchaeota archaeon]|nr:hypothetical protein [Candidatus Woesearchaeota archaeon]